MIKKIFFFLFLTLILIGLIACNQNNENSPSTTTTDDNSTQAVSDENSTTQPLIWEIYSNNRFGYSIRYPERWSDISISQNNDGAVLYDNDGNKLIVYASNYLEDMPSPFERKNNEGFDSTDILLEDGLQATIIQGNDNSKMIYELVTVHDKKEYHFLASVKNSFFEQNKKIIEQMAKSFIVFAYDENPYTIQIRSLMPEHENYHWAYSGFAEYGHEMTLKDIKHEKNYYTFEITGEVYDVSAGESNKDYSLELTYTILPGVLVQEKVEEAMMDSDYDSIELVRTPLQKGNTWTQVVTDHEGNNTTLNCEITDIKDENGLNIYTIEYKDMNSEYYEIRRIKEAVGVLSFTKLFITDTDSFEIGYNIYYSLTGYK